QFQESCIQAAQKLLDSLRAAAQQPRSFRDHRPAGEQRARHVAQGFDAGAVILVAAAEYGNDWARIDQDAPHLSLLLLLPNCLKWRRFVLRSLGAFCTAPIIPASAAMS